MNYHHLTIEERCCLREYYQKGYSYRKIAKLMGRNVSTISRELNRNFTHMYDIPTYYPHTAQKKYKLRRSFCHRGLFQDPKKLEYIKEKLLLTWSPEQIANTPCELDMPSVRTIYRWIYEKYIDVNLKVLRRKGKSRGKKETRGKFNLGKSIRKRARSVYKHTGILGYVSLFHRVQADRKRLDHRTCLVAYAIGQEYKIFFLYKKLRLHSAVAARAVVVISNTVRPSLLLAKLALAAGQDRKNAGALAHESGILALLYHSRKFMTQYYGVKI